jgi:hypothetical protein
LKVKRIRKTCQLLHSLDKLGGLGFCTGCGMTGKRLDVGILRCAGKEEEGCPAYSGISARITFPGQLQPKLAMLVG